MQNPFFYGEEVSGNCFTNRKAEIEDLISDLSRGQNVIVYSPRRYGKTSLMKKVLAVLSAKGVLTFYVNLYAATSKRKFIEIYSRAIARGTRGKIEQVLDQLKKLLPRVIPKIVIKPPGLPEFEIDFSEKAKGLSPILEDLYVAIEKYARKMGKQAVVVFDEFQEILNLEDDEIERTMREYVQSQKLVSYVFMGSKKHLMHKLFNNANRPFYKSGRIFPLKKIGAADFADFIKHKFKGCKILLSNELADKILSLTECHPYYTQMFCSVLWDRNIGKKKITEKAVSEALLEVISRESSNYANLWDGLSQKRKLLLIAIAKSGGAGIYSQEFITEFKLGTPSTIQKGLKALLNKELLEKENGNILFSDIFFKQWVLKNM